MMNSKTGWTNLLVKDFTFNVMHSCFFFFFQENVLPLGERPLLVRVGVHYKFTKLLVDRVEAVDGTYDVLFIGTGRSCDIEGCVSGILKCFFKIKYGEWFIFFLFFLSLDSGLVMKAIHLHREHGQSQEITLEQMQVFQVLQAFSVRKTRLKP